MKRVPVRLLSPLLSLLEGSSFPPAGGVREFRAVGRKGREGETANSG